MTSEGARSKSKISIRGGWTNREDQLLASLVEKAGSRDWNAHAMELNRQTHTDSSCGRTGKQCRERWHNHLRPDISTEPLSEKEQIQLMNCHRRVGNKWSLISESMPGRTENQIKNYVNATIRMREMMLRCKTDTEIENALERCLRLRCSKFTEYIFTLPDLGQGASSGTIDQAAREEIYRKRQRLVEILRRMSDGPRRQSTPASKSASGSASANATTPGVKEEDNDSSSQRGDAFLTRTLSGSVKRMRSDGDMMNSCASDVPQSTTELEAPCHITLDSMLAGSGRRSSQTHSAPGIDDWSPNPNLLDSHNRSRRDVVMSSMPTYSSGTNPCPRDPKRRQTRYSSSDPDFLAQSLDTTLAMHGHSARDWEQVLEASSLTASEHGSHNGNAKFGQSLRGLFHGRRNPLAGQSRLPNLPTSSSSKGELRGAQPRSQSAQNINSWHRAYDSDPRGSMRFNRDMQLESLPELEDANMPRFHRDAIDDALNEYGHDGINSILSEMSTSSTAHDLRHRSLNPRKPSNKLRLHIPDHSMREAGDPFEALLHEGDAYNPFDFSPRSEACPGMEGSIDQLSDLWCTSDNQRHPSGVLRLMDSLRGVDATHGSNATHASNDPTLQVNTSSVSPGGQSAPWLGNGCSERRASMDPTFQLLNSVGQINKPLDTHFSSFQGNLWPTADGAPQRDVPLFGQNGGPSAKEEPLSSWPGMIKTEDTYNMDPQQQWPLSGHGAIDSGLPRAQRPDPQPLQGSPRWEHMLDALKSLQSDL